ncbi:MAG: glycosyltransferase family 39 protein [Candidatus Curtissbacteria bacterium]|nr:glycosyltransferase family 39 protein [Candidatus Curtissbacteria bacterium]
MKRFEFFIRRKDLLILLLILSLAFILRLYKINRPIGDWHSWRQADTAAVARNFIKEGFNPFIPKYDDMSSQTNGLDNPNRYRFVEFPIYNSLIAAVWSFTGVNVTYARLVTVVISLGSTFLLYLLVRKFSGKIVAVLAAFFFATIPYNVFYSSAILPGPLMVFALLGLYLSFAKWMDNDSNWFWVLSSILFANIAILTWPVALFFMVPILYLAFDKYGFQVFKKTPLYLFALLSLVPFIAWRIWETRFPEGIPNWNFLINEGNIRFKGAFFRWLVVERMGKLILTVGGFFLFILGILKKPGREKLFYLSLLASVLLYFSVFASGNVRHDYYQVPAIPVFAIFMALGTKALFKLPRESFNRFIGPLVAVSAILAIFAFGFYEVQGYWWVNKPQIVEAGKAVDRLLPKDATVVAPYNGDTAFLYQTNRYGYPITDRSLEKFIDQGTKYLVSVDPNDAGIQNLAAHCKVVDQTKDYVIVEMFKDCIGK